ncbi:MAG: T9SS type A sorting domain-containing protein [bacterium]|nr:T9SS type A sorting domain-containing protein [bacterium]
MKRGNIYEIIPVELTSFEASVNENDVQLNWSTATETNNSGFEILRSCLTGRQVTQNDNEWNSIGFIPGYGTSTEKHFYSFSDENLVEGNYKFRLKQIDFDGTSTYSEIVEVEIISPEQFVLEQNYPNPFNPSTKIKYSILNVIAIRQLPEKQSQFVVLSVYDILGNEVTTLVNEEKSAGTYEVEFNAGNFPSGVYYYQLKTGEFISTKKMILVK